MTQAHGSIFLIKSFKQLNLLFYFNDTARGPQDGPLAGCITLDVRTIA
jgi:hypothetical protein